MALNVVDLDAYGRVFNSMCDFDQVQTHVEKLPCTALYDFCNAFPTLLHEWLFLVLECYEVPRQLIQIIMWLYTDVHAYSSGAGDGGFLFQILGGVKTGCPLSSVLFLLGINPIVYMFLLLSDGPRLSRTRVCADDFGSALAALRHIKRHASIFKQAAAVSGLHLKPSKCVIVVSGCELTLDLVHGIKKWLLTNVPSFAEFSTASSGKYLGWYLGRDSAITSFAAPPSLSSKIGCRRLSMVVLRRPCL